MIYKKKVSAWDRRWKDRRVQILGFDGRKLIYRTEIDVPDDAVICNGCNENLFDEKEEKFGWLIYLSKEDVKNDTPYDLYCEQCVQKYFPKAKEVTP